MNLSTVKWAQWDKTQSRELLVLFICVCSSLCTIVAHNTAQNRPDNFPSCTADNHHCSDDVYLRERETQVGIPRGFVRNWNHRSAESNCWNIDLLADLAKLIIGVDLLHGHGIVPQRDPWADPWSFFVNVKYAFWSNKIPWNQQLTSVEKYILFSP